MMVLIAKEDRGIIKKGMRFVYLRETELAIECWSVELELNFKISKALIKEFFEVTNYERR